MPWVSSVQVPASPVVGTTGKERLDGLTRAPCAAAAGITCRLRLPKCCSGALVPGSCTSYVPVRIVPTGNLPQSTAGIGLPLKVAPVIVSGLAGAGGAEGAVLSMRTLTV